MSKPKSFRPWQPEQTTLLAGVPSSGVNPLASAPA